MKRSSGLVSLSLLVCLGAYTGNAQTIVDMPPPPPLPVLRPDPRPSIIPSATPIPEKELEFDENDVVRVVQP